MTLNEIDEVIKLLNESDMSEWPLEDQLMVMQAHSKFVNTIAPIVLRNAAKDENVTFIFKIKKGE